MRLSEVLGVKRMAMKTRIFTLGFIITGIMSLAFGVVTFYGQNAGNFVMAIDPESFTRGIQISDTEDFLIPTSRLLANPVRDAKDITYTWLKIDEVLATDGDYYDPDHLYIAYTFYIRNNGTETVDIDYTIRLAEVYKGLDEAIRILVIEDDTIFTMYKKQDTVVYAYPDYMPEAMNFLSELVVVEQTFINFRREQIKKFSIIIWLEGEDPDTTDAVLGGQIKTHITFSIASAE